MKGKFSSEGDQAIYEFASDSALHSDWIGADQFGLVALITCLTPEDAERMDVEPGWYLITETDQGFVDLTHFGEDSVAALTAIRDIEDEFQAWCRAEDPDGEWVD